MNDHPANDVASEGDDDIVLHDRIARHLDGGLDPDEQRRLARQLAGSPEARRVLARYLRLEAAMHRLGHAGLFAASLDTGDQPATDDGLVAPTPPLVDAGDPPRAAVPVWVTTFAWAALAAGLLLAVVLAPPQGRDVAADGAAGALREGQMEEMDRVAEEWLRVARAPGEAVASAAAEPGDDLPIEDVVNVESENGPPAWLVAAMADDASRRTPPDAG